MRIENMRRTASGCALRPLRIKGKGLPEFGSERHGNLYLRIAVQVPETLSREERELYERLRELGKRA